MFLWTMGSSLRMSLVGGSRDVEGKVTPKRMPSPRTMLGHDGTDFVALKTDADGRLVVRGENSLFSFNNMLVVTNTAVISGAGGCVDSVTPPAGQIWAVTNALAVDGTTPTTEQQYFIRIGGANELLQYATAAFAAGRYSVYKGRFWLVPGTVLRVYFIGGLVGDTCAVRLIGHSMTIEA